MDGFPYGMHSEKFEASYGATCKELLKTGHVMNPAGWKLEAVLGKDLCFL